MQHDSCPTLGHNSKPQEALQPNDHPYEHVNPLTGFEPLAISHKPPLKGQGQRLHKPSAYVRNLAQGKGTSTGHANAPTYPCGIQVPHTTADTAASAMNPEPNHFSFTGLGSEAPMIEGEPSVMHFTMAAAESTLDNPKSVKHVKQLEDWPKWDKLIRKELDLHDKVGTWELVEPPLNVNIIGS